MPSHIIVRCFFSSSRTSVFYHMQLTRITFLIITLQVHYWPYAGLTIQPMHCLVKELDGNGLVMYPENGIHTTWNPSVFWKQHGQWSVL